MASPLSRLVSQRNWFKLRIKGAAKLLSELGLDDQAADLEVLCLNQLDKKFNSKIEELRRKK